MLRCLLAFLLIGSASAVWDLLALIKDVHVGDAQSAGVKGRLLCGDKPASEVKLKLYEHDTADPDDLMAELFTDQDGRFEVNGTEWEKTRIKPKLNVYHKCGHPDAICLRKLVFWVPRELIFDGNTDAIKELYDIGEINLAGSYDGESVDCLN